MNLRRQSLISSLMVSFIPAFIGDSAARDPIPPDYPSLSAALEDVHRRLIYATTRLLYRCYAPHPLPLFPPAPILLRHALTNHA